MNKSANLLTSSASRGHTATLALDTTFPLKTVEWCIKLKNGPVRWHESNAVTLLTLDRHRTGRSPCTKRQVLCRGSVQGVPRRQELNECSLLSDIG